MRDCILKARAKGVIFDVGHGQGSFSWEMAEICAENSFYPDVISTDLHSGNIGGLAKDLPWVMSKFLHLGIAICLINLSQCCFPGMELDKILKSVTLTPAASIGKHVNSSKSDTIGNINGCDWTVLKLEDVDLSSEDCSGKRRQLKKIFVPKYVVRKGVFKVLE